MKDNNLSGPVRHDRPFGFESVFENLLTYKQAAQCLGLSEPYLRKLKASGQLPYVVVGSRAIRFRMSSLTRWIEEREIKNET